jgi:hypothetical protein
LVEAADKNTTHGWIDANKNRSARNTSTPANIIPDALQKQGAHMPNEHQINNQRTRGSITVKRKKLNFFSSQIRFLGPFFSEIPTNLTPGFPQVFLARIFGATHAHHTSI